jgi:hypothetical protein
MTLQMRVTGIECKHYDKALANLFIHVTQEQLAPYGLGTLHAVTIAAG